MKILKFIAIAVAALVAVILVVSFATPTHFEYERSTVIDAPRDQVWPHVSTFQGNHTWSPWVEKDPDAKYTYSGQAGEVGAQYSWDGNDDVGAGMQELISVRPKEGVEHALTFTRPWESEAKAYINLEDEDKSTRVKWRMTNDLPRPFNLTTYFFNMEGMMNEDFDRGLAKLKNIVEAEEVKLKMEIRQQELSERHFIVVRKEIPMSELSSFYSTYIPELDKYATEKEIKGDGYPSSLVYEWNEETGRTDIAAAIPVSSKDVDTGSYSLVTVPASTYVVGEHIGKYEGLYQAHTDMFEYLKKNNLKLGGIILEEYVSDPGQTKEEDLITRIVYSFKKPVAENM